MPSVKNVPDIEDMAQLVERLPSMHKALGAVLSTS